MNKTNLLQKLAPVGVAAFGAVSFIGIPSAQASTGALGFSNGTSNFFSTDIGNVGQADFTVEFVSPLFTDVVTEVDGASGKFAPFFGPFPDIVPLLSTPTSTFSYVRAEGPDSFIYQNNQNIVFEFDTNGDNTTAEVEVIYGAGSQFLGSFDTVGGAIDGIGFEEFSVATEVVTIQGEGSFTTVPRGDGSFIDGIELVFEDIPETTIGGEYGGSVSITKESIPEPTAVLGLLTFGGLGLGLKRKKQS